MKIWNFQLTIFYAHKTWRFWRNAEELYSKIKLNFSCGVSREVLEKLRFGFEDKNKNPNTRTFYNGYIGVNSYYRIFQK